MACGIPVVGSKVDGGREALRDGMLGILVDSNSKEEIKQGIMEVLKRPRGVIPEGLDYFSFANFETRLHRLVDEVVGKG
jgi:phosphatidylinositol alpha-1,6-mannosyltransferase